MVFQAVADAYHSLGKSTGLSSVSVAQKEKDANKIRLLRIAAIVAFVFNIAITAVFLSSSPLVALTLGAAGIFTTILFYDVISVLKNMEDALSGVVKKIGGRFFGYRQAPRAYFTDGTLFLRPIVLLTTKNS